jgi:hypothetical protein
MDSWHIALAGELITCTIHGNLLKVLHWLPWGHYERKNCLPLQALWRRFLLPDWHAGQSLLQFSALFQVIVLPTMWEYAHT